MNTIERVALAIRAYLKEASNVRYVLPIGGYIGCATGMVYPDATSLSSDAAKAALEALADGLEWRDSPCNVRARLMFNSIQIGECSEWSGPDGTSHWKVYLIDCSEILISEVFPTEQNAKDALMSRARSWIMGIEPDGNMG